MSLVLQSSGGGSVTIQEPTTASNFTATMPAATGTVMVSGNQPAFSAYPNANQSLGAAANTKLLFQTEEYDTNNNFASSRFTPTVAGYYQINACVRPNATNGEAQIQIFKNNNSFKAGSNVLVNSGTQQGTIVSSLTYANGTTDYFEIFVYVTNACTISGSETSTWVNGVLVRAA
jgi:hypothetical protein